jgi:hypothetical protein
MVCIGFYAFDAFPVGVVIELALIESAVVFAVTANHFSMRGDDAYYEA